MVLNLDSKSCQFSISLEGLQDQLSEFGLTPNQSKVFIFLEKYGSKTAPELSKVLMIPRTEIYHILTALQNKGIVSKAFRYPTRFSALPLDKALWSLVNAEKERIRKLEKQERALTELWRFMSKKHKHNGHMKPDPESAKFATNLDFGINQNYYS